MWNVVQQFTGTISAPSASGRSCSSAQSVRAPGARFVRSFFLVALSLSLTFSAGAAEVKLLNVSYDVTREFYQDYNAAFAAYWKAKTGDTVTVNQSHGGSSKQAQAVVVDRKSVV